MSDDLADDDVCDLCGEPWTDCDCDEDDEYDSSDYCDGCGQLWDDCDCCPDCGEASTFCICDYDEDFCPDCDEPWEDCQCEDEPEQATPLLDELED